MSNNPLVSIITPSYNQAKFIRETIESVLSQNYPNFEYIVIDGGSIDGTIDILCGYGERLKWVSEKDNGQSDAINKGFKMAKGEIVAWLNSDDTYEPGAISAAVKAFQENPQAGLVYGEGNIIDENNCFIMKFNATENFGLWRLIHLWDYILQPTTFFKRDALVKVGFLDENLHYCMDWDLWIRIGLEYQVVYITNILANSREYSATKTSTGGWKRFNEIVTLMRKYGDMLYPPGYFLYGADTLNKQLSVIPGISKIMRWITSKINYHTLNSVPSIFPDNWAGQTCNIWMPTNVVEGNHLKLHINVPDFSRDLYITVLLNDEKIQSEKLNPGVNNLLFNIDKNKKISKIVLKCNCSFVPALKGTSLDNRKLSYQIVNLI